MYSGFHYIIGTLDCIQLKDTFSLLKTLKKPKIDEKYTVTKEQKVQEMSTQTCVFITYIVIIIKKK